MVSCKKNYFPIQVRVVVRRVLRNCIIYKKLHGSPSEQLMADLPVSRVKANGYTFKHTGIDLFVSMVTKTGYRAGRRAKRYGVLLICL